MSYKTILYLTLICWWSICQLAEAAIKSAEVNKVIEIRFKTEKSHIDPFNTIIMDVVFTDPTGAKNIVPAFWSGDNLWKVRYSSSIVGVHHYHTQCSDIEDTGLNGIEGQIKIKPYTGNNLLFRHGAIGVSSNGRYFQYANGTPFFWLGDTWWKGLCKRLTWEGFKELSADRKAKGFNVVQIVCGPYPDEVEFDPRMENEGGLPFEKDYSSIRPQYFDYADRRIEYLVEEGFVPVIFGAWGYHLNSVGMEKMKQYWRYLIARYGAYPVVWSIVGEAMKGGPGWTEIAQYVQKVDPYHRAATIHSSWGRNYITDETSIDFDMIMPGQGSDFGAKKPLGDWDYTTTQTTAMVSVAYNKKPPMPVVIGEVCYEGHMMTNGAELQRQIFWSSILSGTRGYTYGAEGIWQMNSETERGAEYAFTPWFEGMQLPGSTQLGLARKLLEEYPWWQLEPHPEWVDPHSTTLEIEWTSESALGKEFESRDGRWDLPYASGIPGEIRIIYIPGHYYDWTAPTVKGLELNVPYHVFLFDPVRAKRYELGLVVNVGNDYPKEYQIKKWKEKAISTKKYLSLIMHENPYILPEVKIPEVTFLKTGDYKLPRLPAPQDWVVIMEKVGE
jgi:hypothetical protein